jgi:site-specific DNA-adenine methylase
MTAYHGGKCRTGRKLSKEIYDISQRLSSKKGIKINGYCEPFCGMLGVYRHMPSLFDEEYPKMKYRAGDTHNSLLRMWNRVQKGWKPPTHITSSQYTALKKKRPSALKGYAGFGYSYGGLYFRGYSEKYGRKKNGEKYSKSIQKIGKDLKDVKFTRGTYTQFSNLKGYVIYCDPPYKNAVQNYYDEKLKKIETFDSDHFWKWCEKMSKNNIVIVSEYNAPNTFTKIKQKSSSINYTNNGKKTVSKISEHLYVK